MMDQYYTLGAWTVKPGNEDTFVESWKAVGAVFAELDAPPGRGTLLQSVQDPTRFYSFGPWPSLDAIQAMRDDPDAGAAIGKLMALCSQAEPGAFRVVASGD